MPYKSICFFKVSLSRWISMVQLYFYFQKAFNKVLQVFINFGLWLLDIHINVWKHDL